MDDTSAPKMTKVTYAGLSVTHEQVPHRRGLCLEMKPGAAVRMGDVLIVVERKNEGGRRPVIRVIAPQSVNVEKLLPSDVRKLLGVEQFDDGQG